MRVTGAGDPRQAVQDTLVGKLPQRKLTTGAAKGYSSYGNQIGLATGEVKEYYNPGSAAKRMEIGAVLGAAPRKNVVREEPLPGDIIILLAARPAVTAAAALRVLPRNIPLNPWKRAVLKSKKGTP